MEKDYNKKILNSYKKVRELYAKTNDKMIQFVTNASEFVVMSENLYQIERTIKLNKISIKAYILDSNCCKYLANNNISNYSINELKEYFKKYEQEKGEICDIYIFAINVYEILEEIETLVDERIDFELNEMSNLIKIINDIRNVSKEDLENLYLQIKNQLMNNFLNLKLINNEAYNNCMFMINDIFNYYISGYPNIPEEYLNFYKAEDNN